MKKMLIVVCLFAFFSCEKQYPDTSQNQEAYQVSVAEEMLHFPNEEAFLDFFTEYFTADLASQRNLLNKFSFESYEDYIANLHIPFESMETEDEFVNYISKYRFDITLIENDFGEKEVLIINSPNVFIDQFVNAEKLLKIGDNYQKYIGNYVVSSKSLDDFTRINSEDDVRSSQLDYFNLESDFQSRTGDLGIVFEDQNVKNLKWCKNDRSVHFHWTVNDLNIPAGTNSYQLLKGTEIHGKKKGIPCIWYRYYSIWRTKNADFRNTHGSNNSDTWTFADYTSSSIEWKHLEEKLVDAHTQTYSWRVANSGWVWPVFTKERIDYNSQGVTDWKSLNQ